MSSFLVLMSSFISMATCWGSTESSSRSCPPVSPRQCGAGVPMAPQSPGPPTHLLAVLALEVQTRLDVPAGLLESLTLRHLGRVVGADPHHVGAEEDQGVGTELVGEVDSARPNPESPASSATLLCTPKPQLCYGGAVTMGHKGGRGAGRHEGIGTQGRGMWGCRDLGTLGTRAGCMGI